jgi:hypothetical protein
MATSDCHAVNSVIEAMYIDVALFVAESMHWEIIETSQLLKRTHLCFLVLMVRWNC